MSLLSHEDRNKVHGEHFNVFARSGQPSPPEVKPACWYVTMFQDDEQESPVRSGAEFPGDQAQRALKKTSGSWQLQSEDEH